MTCQILHRRKAIAKVFSGAIVTFTLFATLGAVATGANLTLIESGKKLVADAKCEACHASKRGADGSDMYLRQDRRVSTKSKLLAQVARCNSDLSLGLFPDDEAAIAAYLNAAHYKFKE